MMSNALRVFPIIGLAFLTSEATADGTRDAVLAWSAELREAERAAATAHPATFNSQIGSFYIGIFEAVNASTGARWDTFSGMTLPSNARADLAASYAAHAFLSAIYGDSKADFDSRLAILIAGANAQEIAAAQAVGTAAFDAVRSNHTDTRSPFFTASAAQFLPPPPPAIDSDKYTADYIQVKEYGGVGSTERTEEQSEIALFWSDNRTGTMASMHWNAETILAEQKLDGIEFARSMALFAGGLHDAIVSVSASKAVYKTDRPVAAIHKGETDGNPRTQGDPSWIMFGNNVPPEDLSYSYASGGGTLGSYFANMIGRLIATDDVSFDYRHLDNPDTRSFNSLSDMQTEFGWSRIYNGEHFMHDVEAGWRMSEQIADYIYTNALSPVDQ